MHEQKKKEKSKKLRNTVACQPATAWKDKARKKGTSRFETGRTEGETKRERETTPSNANPKQPNLRNENPNRCSCGYEQVLGGCLVFNLRTAGSGVLAKIFSNHFGFENENPVPKCDSSY